MKRPIRSQQIVSYALIHAEPEQALRFIAARLEQIQQQGAEIVFSASINEVIRFKRQQLDGLEERRTNYSRELKQQILQAVKKGGSYQQIAERFGVSKATVCRVAKLGRENNVAKKV